MGRENKYEEKKKKRKEENEEKEGTCLRQEVRQPLSRQTQKQ